MNAAVRLHILVERREPAIEALATRRSHPDKTTVVTVDAMNEIQLGDAKATLSAMVDQALKGAPSIHHPPWMVGSSGA